MRHSTRSYAGARPYINACIRYTSHTFTYAAEPSAKADAKAAPHTCKLTMFVVVASSFSLCSPITRAGLGRKLGGNVTAALSE